MGEFTCLVGLNRARIFLEFGWPQWGKSMSERAEKAEALAARIKPILAGNDPDIKGKRRRSFLPAPQRLSRANVGNAPPEPAGSRRRWRRGTPRNAKPNCTNDPKGYGYRTPPANSTMKLFSCARTTRTTPTSSPQPFNSSPRRATPTRPSDRNAPKLPPSLQSENPRTGRGWRYK
jgi:hypothetical protein